MLDKIQRWDYVDLAELLPSANIHDAAASVQSPRFSLFAGWEFVRPKRKQIDTILDWVQAFSIYMAALVAKFPEVTTELISYQLTIIKAAQQYDGLQWRAYDTHYRINAAATGLRHWSKLDTDLYTRFFTGRARAIACCSICDSTMHQAPDCPRRPRKREGGKAPLSPSPLAFKKRRQWAADVCAEFNAKGSCSFKERCKFKHLCGECGEQHPARSCSVVKEH